MASRRIRCYYEASDDEAANDTSRRRVTFGASAVPHEVIHEVERWNYQGAHARERGVACAVCNESILDTYILDPTPRSTTLGSRVYRRLRLVSANYTHARPVEVDSDGSCGFESDTSSDEGDVEELSEELQGLLQRVAAATEVVFHGDQAVGRAVPLPCGHAAHAECVMRLLAGAVGKDVAGEDLPDTEALAMKARQFLRKGRPLPPDCTPDRLREQAAELERAAALHAAAPLEERVECVTCSTDARLAGTGRTQPLFCLAAPGVLRCCHDGAGCHGSAALDAALRCVRDNVAGVLARRRELLALAVAPERFTRGDGEAGPDGGGDDAGGTVDIGQVFAANGLELPPTLTTQ